MTTEPRVALSKPVGDEVRKTTCYMCACRCGINVHLKDGKIRYIEGNRDHPVNKGVLCAKGSAGIMQHYAPARLRAPLLRTGPRGSGEFREISWDEALTLAADWLGRVRQSDPKKPRLLYWPRSIAIADRLLGATIWNAQLCRAWRLLLCQHGSRRHYDNRRRLLGIRRAGLGAHEALCHVRRGGGSRFQSAEDWHLEAQEETARVSSRSIRFARAIRR